MASYDTLRKQETVRLVTHDDLFDLRRIRDVAQARDRDDDDLAQFATAVTSTLELLTEQRMHPSPGLQQFTQKLHNTTRISPVSAPFSTTPRRYAPRMGAIDPLGCPEVPLLLSHVVLLPPPKAGSPQLTPFVPT